MTDEQQADRRSFLRTGAIAGTALVAGASGAIAQQVGGTPAGAPIPKVAVFVRLDAKPGKEAEVETFLKGGQSIVEQEPATIAWFGIRLGPSTFGIFDAFPNEAGRQAHMSGGVAAALMAKAPELFATPPVIQMVDVLASKLP